MKKILFLNNDQYHDLKCYRMAKAGRLELLRVLNDPPPYWFVMIRNFNQSDTGADRSALEGLTTPYGNGVWRYLDEQQAYAKFHQLGSLPIFVIEREKAEKTANKRRERLEAVRYDPQELLTKLSQAKSQRSLAVGGQSL